MKVGDLVSKQTMAGYGAGHKLVIVPGTCVYIHPERRYYTLEFNLPGGKIREDYNFQHRRGEVNENNINR